MYHNDATDIFNLSWHHAWNDKLCDTEPVLRQVQEHYSYNVHSCSTLHTEVYLPLNCNRDIIEKVGDPKEKRDAHFCHEVE